MLLSGMLTEVLSLLLQRLSAHVANVTAILFVRVSVIRLFSQT